MVLRSTQGLGFGWAFGFGAVTVHTGLRTDEGREPATYEIRNLALL